MATDYRTDNVADGRRQTPPEQNPEVAGDAGAKGEAAGNGQGGERFPQQLSAIKAKLIEEKNDYIKIHEFLRSDSFSSLGSYKKHIIMALALTMGSYVEQLTMLCKLEMATCDSNNGGDDNGKEK